MLRIRFVAVAASLGLMILGTGMASGQATSTGSGEDYPSKSIRIVTASPGSGIDFNARQIAQGLSDSLGQQAIVENRIGIVPAETVSGASPDG